MATSTLDLMTALRDSLAQRSITPAPEPGVYPGKPMELYHRWEAASNSRLSRIRQSPAHLLAYLNEPPKETLALRMGRAIHTAILEPDSFDDNFVVASQCEATKRGDGKRCSNNGIIFDAKLGWLCGVHGKDAIAVVDDRLVMSGDDLTVCRGARDSVYQHSTAAKILKRLQHVELSIVWIDPVTGMKCKARFDGLAGMLGGIVADIKSTTNASERAFPRSAFDLGYHRQGAFYLDGAAANAIEVTNYLNIAVEKDPPFACAVYSLTDGSIDAGRAQLAPLKRRYAECMATGIYPAYPDKVIDLALPDYAWKQIDDEVSFGTNYEVTG